MWDKKMWLVFNRKNDYCYVWPKEIVKQTDRWLGWFLNVDVETNLYWATSNKRCYITIKQHHEVQKPLTSFDFMTESRVFVMQHILIKENSQGT